MSKLPQISEAEFEVMKVIWKYAPISTNEVTEKLTQTTDWSPKTIQTMLKRLVTKKALTYEKQSRVFVYTPLVPETELKFLQNSQKAAYTGPLLLHTAFLFTSSAYADIFHTRLRHCAESLLSLHL